MPTQKELIDYAADYYGLDRDAFTATIGSNAVVDNLDTAMTLANYASISEGLQKSTGDAEVPEVSKSVSDILQDALLPPKVREKSKNTTWGDTAKAAKGAVSSPMNWIKSIGIDLIFVAGGLALIVASIYTALHGVSLPGLVVNAGKAATKI